MDPLTAAAIALSVFKVGLAAATPDPVNVRLARSYGRAYGNLPPEAFPPEVLAALAAERERLEGGSTTASSKRTAWIVGGVVAALAVGGGIFWLVRR